MRTPEKSRRRPNWLAALLGAVLLGGAYYLAVTIENPVQTLVWFFVAVIMVIIASYLLFVAGSVVICKLLQKKKGYYYKTNHFVSVSSMAYRMKRNGAGLASICILCTMVLVMISSTVCLYIGAEDSMRTRYPRNINLDITFKSLEDMDGEKPNAVRQIVEKTAAENGESLQNVLDYRVAGFAAYMKNGVIETNSSHLENFQLDYYSDVWQIFIVPVSDYNRLMGETRRFLKARLSSTQRNRIIRLIPFHSETVFR